MLKERFEIQDARYDFEEEPEMTVYIINGGQNSPKFHQNLWPILWPRMASFSMAFGKTVSRKSHESEILCPSRSGISQT